MSEPGVYFNFTFTCQRCFGTVEVEHGREVAHDCPPPAQDAPSVRTDPGEGDGTGSGPVEAHGGAEGSAVDAAIRAAVEAISTHWSEAGGWYGQATYGSVAEAAVRAAEPILRQAVAEQIALAIEARRRELAAIDNLEDNWDDGTDSLHAAAAIAREVGRGA